MRENEALIDHSLVLLTGCASYTYTARSTLARSRLSSNPGAWMQVRANS